jgi:ATP-binding cassette subfamily F protein 3
MLFIRNLTVTFSTKILFDDISLQINRNEKIGLIGNNGTGKTTLLKIISGESDIIFDGKIEKPGQFRIGYLPQEIDFDSDQPILELVKEAVPDVYTLETKISGLEQALDDSRHPEEKQVLGQQITELHNRLQEKDGYRLASEAEKILAGLGFKKTEMKQPLSHFSGGWRMRVFLARILMGDNDLLLLDEPTNHLDLESIIWFENYIRQTNATVIVVSHDQSFLDQTVDKIAEIYQKKITLQVGNLSMFEAQREERQRLQEKKYLEQQREIQEIERFIERFRYKNTKAKQVQSRVKMLERMDKIAPPESRTEARNFRFPTPPPVDKELLTIDAVAFGYTPDQSLFEDVTLSVYRQDKFALLGKNGIGKSTFVKLIAGLLSPQAGEIKRSARARFGYFAQHAVENLNPEADIYTEVYEHADSALQTSVREVLGVFMFSGDDQYKPIKVLSGGEKTRVALAKLFVSPANILILDEPTNHLDRSSKAVLTKAIDNYAGACIIISHDEHFLTQVARNVLYIENKKIRKYEGTYREFVSVIRSKTSPESGLTAEVAASDNQAQRQQRKDRQREIRQKQSLIAQLEGKIESLEMAIAEQEQKQLDPKIYSDGQLAKEAQDTLDELNSELEQTLSLWEKSNHALSHLQQEQ